MAESILNDGKLLAALADNTAVLRRAVRECNPNDASLTDVMGSLTSVPVRIALQVILATLDVAHPAIRRAAVAREQLEVKQREYLRACETMAAMHTAAVGEDRPPTRGMVEDVEDLRLERDNLKARCILPTLLPCEAKLLEAARLFAAKLAAGSSSEAMYAQREMLMLAQQLTPATDA